MLGRDVILFDLDGTLTDPGLGIGRCVNHALAALGRAPADEHALSSFIGPPIREGFSMLGVPDADIERAVSIYRERYVEVGMFECELVTGIEEALGALSDNGATLAVATSKVEVYAERILEHFAVANYFEIIAGADLEGRHAEKAAIITDCLTRLKRTEHDRVVMIGDRLHDIEGAAANGVASVGVVYGYGAPGELGRAGATAVAGSPYSLVPVVRWVLSTLVS